MASGMDRASAAHVLMHIFNLPDICNAAYITSIHDTRQDQLHCRTNDQLCGGFAKGIGAEMEGKEELSRAMG
jgi:hypothetical protein